MLKKRILGFAVSILMLLNSSALLADESKLEITKAGGWNESIFAEFNALSGRSYKAEYKLSGESQFTEADDELVRINDNIGRVDIVGLKGNESYDLKISDGSNVITLNNIKTSSYDRSGYAHWNMSETGIGAYNNDGTIKEDAIIVYLSDAEKNTVQANIDGKDYTGIVNILYYASKSDVPIDVRVLDKITCPQYKGAELSTDEGFELIDEPENDGTTPFTNFDGKKFQYTSIEQEEAGSKNEKYGYFPFNMISIKNASNLTIEGIGENAQFYQWGVSFSPSASIEVRNITFSNAPDDCVDINGNSSTNSENIWIHNNIFNIGKNLYDASKDGDKGEGDGSTDVNRAKNITVSYNIYNDCHKTSLCGSGSSIKPENITYHHNFFNATQSRNPRVRNANVHSYNNYFYNIKSYGTSASYNSSIFSEANYYENSKNPLVARAEGSDKYSGAVKSWNDAFSECTYSSFEDDAYYEAKSRDDVTEIANKKTGGEAYNHFDTDSQAFYYDESSKQTDADVQTAEAAKSTVKKYSGVMTEKGSNMLDLSDTAKTFEYGDADANGVLTANDAAVVFKKSIHKEEYKMPVENEISNYTSIVDVDGKDDITSDDANLILQKVLDKYYEFPVEQQ